MLLLLLRWKALAGGCVGHRIEISIIYPTTALRLKAESASVRGRKDTRARTQPRKQRSQTRGADIAWELAQSYRLRTNCRGVWFNMSSASIGVGVSPETCTPPEHADAAPSTSVALGHLVISVQFLCF